MSPASSGRIVAPTCCTVMPRSAAASLLSRIDSAGVGRLLRGLEVGDALAPCATFAANSLISVRQRLRIGAQQVDPDRPVEAERELDAGDRLQLLADRRLDLLLRARALGAVDELQVDARVVAAFVGADRRHRQRDLGERLQRRLDLPHLAVGVLEARADRRVEPQRDEALVGLRDELGADQRHDARSCRRTTTSAIASTLLRWPSAHSRIAP